MLCVSPLIESGADFGNSLYVRGPTLVAVKDSDQFQSIPSNSIGNNVRGIGYHKFSGPEYPSRSPHLGVKLKQFNRFENALGYKRGALLGVFSDELPEGEQVLYRSLRPDDLHRGAFASPGLPQVLSHFETFS